MFHKERAFGEESDHTLDHLLEFWNHLYGSPQEPTVYLNVFSGVRPPGENDKANKQRLRNVTDEFFAWPNEREKAAKYVLEMSDKEYNVYCCAHLLVRPKRKKDYAASISCLWADGDKAKIPVGFPHPTLTVESSPDRYHYYWRLERRIASDRAEKLNRKIAYMIGADKSGWDLTQPLRIPGTKNYDYARVYTKTPIVQVVG